jgi:hypothetical protein
VSIERGVRQLLANKVSGNLAGIWLLIPEHLRLGTWDLLNSWNNNNNNNSNSNSRGREEQINLRLAMQLINEASLCARGIREKRTLSQKGFELANGLPFVASDKAIHDMLDTHRVLQSILLQIALGKIRLTFGHFRGELLVIDPHRIKTYSKRQMTRRKKEPDSRPCKMAQTFFCLDADTKQPICFTTGTSARSVTNATPELLQITEKILNINFNININIKEKKKEKEKKKVLVLADNEHYTTALMDWIYSQSPFDMLVPMKNKKLLEKQLKTNIIPPEAFKMQWAGYATAKIEHKMKDSCWGPYHEFIQRNGEQADNYDYSSFLCTSNRDEVKEMTINYPQRWHIEEFFKNDQALGWDRFGTMNLNIQYGKMTMSLFAQAAIHMMRQRLGKPFEKWDSQHLANDIFNGLEGDIRVNNDTIVVTYYNADNVKLLKANYENLPQKLEEEGVNPGVPWLYNYKIDFRFK